MIYLISFLNNFFSPRLLSVLLGGIVLSGCAGNVSPQLASVSLVNAPAVRTVTAQKSSPQMAGSEEIVWQAERIENSETEVFSFEIRGGNGRISIVQQGTVDKWSWRPEQAGTYQVRVISTGENGNKSTGPWSEPFEITPPLEIKKFTPDRPAPQMAGASQVNWAVAAIGGVGEHSITFELERNGGSPAVAQSGSASNWVWSADFAGNYRVRVIVEDALGHQAESAWSSLYEIAPPLVLKSLVPDQPTPQMVGTGPFPWTVSAVGGVGSHLVRFELEKDGGTPEVVQSGEKKIWQWLPTSIGSYRVRSRVEDTLSHQVVSSWSEPFEITPPLVVGTPQTEKSSPQAALTKPIDWTIEATGGVEPLSYELEVEQDGNIKLKVFAKSTPGWTWKPSTAGSYRIRASAIDARGNRVESGWSAPYEIVPQLVIQRPVAEIAGPQVIDTKLIPWSVAASGGVGETSIAFELSFNDGKPVTLANEPSLGGLIWQPEKPGTYRLRALMTDSLGNQQASEWSAPYRIEPPLTIEEFVVDRPAPQAAQSVGILWTAHASGGVGDKSYAFELSRNEETGPLTEQGLDPTWQWSPELEGSYRIRIVVTDILGNSLTSDWTKPYEIVPALKVTMPEPDNPANQYMVHSPVNWHVQSSGGVGKKAYTFIFTSKTGVTETLPNSSSNVWKWRPATAGFYRVQVLVTDALGNQHESSWSNWKEIRDPLSLGALKPSRPSPQTALKGTIRWQTEVSGGVGTVSYEFRSLMSGIESIEQTGPSATLDWDPRIAGHYQIKVHAWDEDDHVTESDWSDEYLITPAITANSLIAFLPLENLADVKVASREIGDLYSGMLGAELQLLPAEKLEHFMQTHRMRYTGGISSTLAKALQEETGAEAVFITNLETWSERGSPRVSMLSRLVTTGGTPEIVWIDSVGLTGEDSPLLLGLGLINNAQELLEKALEQLLVSFRAYLAGNYPSYRHAAGQRGLRLINGKTGTADGSIGAVKGRHEPQFSYRASNFDPAGQYSVAVIPFLNINARKHAGGIVALHTVKQLHRYANIRVLEPGLIRETLLKYRMIMQSGPSLAASDVLTNAEILGADIIVSGRAFDYQGDIGESKVDFSMLAFDGSKREVLWASRSYAVGNSGV
ncbi:MAG: hypothetical protein PF495_09815 [Spirochaetales bacterium]|jgi:hypothetical protein|nr:hypothetical protein [Spirochaetales bacterium]